MPRGAGQKEKLFRILSFLMSHTDEQTGVSVGEVIAHLEQWDIFAERKSIYDDFLTLGDLGFPVKKLGTRPERYTLEERVFTLAELKTLADAVQASKFITKERSRALIAKLEQFAGLHKSELERAVYVENRAKTKNEDVLDAVDTIHRAIRSSRKLSFRYFEYTSQKTRVFRRGGARYEISPYALIWSDENYYLIAYDNESDMIKHYRVDKMENLEICKELCEKPEKYRKFDPADHSAKTFEMYGGKEELVVLECADRLAGAMIDRFGTEPTFLTGDGGFRVALRLAVSPTFYGWVMGFGTDMKIVSPPHVREELRARLDALVASYTREVKA